MPLRNDSRQTPSVALGSVINPCILVALFGFSPKNLKLSSLRSAATVFSALIAARLLILLDWKSSHAPSHNNWVCDLMSCGFGTHFFPSFPQTALMYFYFNECLYVLMYLCICLSVCCMNWDQFHPLFFFFYFFFDPLYSVLRWLLIILPATHSSCHYCWSLHRNHWNLMLVTAFSHGQQKHLLRGTPNSHPFQTRGNNWKTTHMQTM